MRHLIAFLSVSFAVAALAGCSSGTVTGVPQSGNAVGKPATAIYQLVYSFGSIPNDGAGPIAGLINRKGLLYGTTANGGKATCGTESYGCGTVFSVTTTGTETVLHRFGLGYGDTAIHPYAGVVALNGALYGTTAISGPCTGTYLSCGTVYSIGAYGAYSILHSFTGVPDGSAPDAPLVAQSGLLYGTTYTGGALNQGTVFSISPSGTETVLHSFSRGGVDGASPASNLVYVNGVFYGTTALGGANDLGTVFSITPGGTETVLHSFGGSRVDGAVPQAGLVALKGMLYGTTSAGGSGRCLFSSLSGCGTIFSITPSPSGTEAVLHSFGGSDGANPVAGLLAKNGVLYGTTFSGGSGSCNVNGSSGCGTVFSVTRNGAETVLHEFGGSGDGTGPAAPLMYLNGVLYGTTETGGANNAGTVFGLIP